jgi:hypothetical protein
VKEIRNSIQEQVIPLQTEMPEIVHPPKQFLLPRPLRGCSQGQGNSIDCKFKILTILSASNKNLLSQAKIFPSFPQSPQSSSNIEL